jgi:hypothetical protein
MVERHRARTDLCDPTRSSRVLIARMTDGAMRASKIVTVV